MSPKGLPVSIAVFFVTTAMLFLAVRLTDSFAIKIFNGIPVHFDSFSMDSEMPNYTDYVDKNTYLSGSVVFDPMAMAGHYQLTKSLMNSVLEPNCLREDMIEWKHNGNGYSPQLSDKVTINGILKDYWGLVLLLSVVVLITLVIPITGILFCCCRGCGNCGAKSEPSDKKRDWSYKMFQGVVLIALGTLLLMCVVCAFATNQQIKEGTNEFPDNIRKSYSDATTFLTSVDDQFTNLLILNYNQFAEVFNSTIRSTGRNVLEQMGSWKNASAILYINNFLETMPKITKDLNSLMTNTDQLKVQVNNLDKELTELKTSLTNTLDGCTLNECTEMIQKISTLQLNIDVSKIPDLSTVKANLSSLNIDELKTAAEDGVANLDQLEQNINDTLMTTIESVSNQINIAGTTISDNLKTMNDVVKDLRTQINNVNTTMESTYHYVTTYSRYFYYGGLVMNCVLLLIPICLTLGLFWGVCGKRPEKHSPSSCTKDTGSVFLVSGVTLIFIFTIFIGILTCIMLSVGLAADRGFCYPLRNPEQSTVINIIDDYIEKNNQVNLDLRIREIFVRCRNNESLYQVFNLSSKFDIDEINTKFDVNGTVTNIIDTIKDQLHLIIDDKTFNILNATNLATLEELTLVNTDIQFDSFQSELNHAILNMDLQNLIEPLDRIKLLDPTIETKIEVNIQSIKKINESLQQIIITAQETLILAEALNTDLKMDSTSFSEAISIFLKDVQDAQDQLRTNTNEIVEAATVFGELVNNQVQSYLDRVISVIKNELGRCGPLNVATDSVLIATCDKIVLPWNGFWVSLFISLLVFIPTIIVSIHLASLYRRYKISKHLSGGERFKFDSKPKKGNMKDKRFSSESRYDDMAPNIFGHAWRSNWILLHPEGTKISRSLFEYERPPPYYYPGFFEL